MGIAAGPAPDTALYDAVYEAYFATERSDDLRWTIGRDKWHAIQRLRDGGGQYLWREYTLTMPDTPTLMGYPVDVVYEELDTLRLGRATASTGKTERLMVVCHACAGLTPSGARFCIECGATL